ncbi:membrane protein [Arthrobacter phage Paella]|nr:membrane protein [Arthrobacter phage Paella]
MNEKIKAFYQKHELVIVGALTLAASVTLVVLVMKLKSHRSMMEGRLSDDLTDEEWEHLFELARQMDDFVAERKAMKLK